LATVEIGLLVASTVTLGAPLILAALGGLTSERAGVMNIALEGTMLASSCTVAIIGLKSQNPWIALSAGIAVSVCLMMLHAVLTQAFSIDQIISGMAINALSIGGTGLLSKALLNDTDLARSPFLSVTLYWWAAVVAVGWLAFYLKRTKGGLHLLAVGNDPDKSRQMGLEPVKVRYLALMATGLLCGVAGALIVSNSGNFSENMTAGRGYIALAALIIGGWRPIPTLVACLVFGLIQASQLHFQGTQLAGANVPPEFWNALPYLVTLIALAGLLGKSRAPAGLGKP